MSRQLGQSIPPAKDFPGLLAHDLGGGREILVSGWGVEAEAVLAEAVALRSIGEER